jgi:hypothetical protein
MTLSDVLQMPKIVCNNNSLTPSSGCVTVLKYSTLQATITSLPVLYCWSGEKMRLITLSGANACFRPLRVITLLATVLLNSDSYQGTA